VKFVHTLRLGVVFMVELTVCNRVLLISGVESTVLTNLSEGFVVFSEQVFVTFSLIITDGVVGIGEFCKVGDIFTGQRGKVGVVKVLSHGGVIVCALSRLSFRVCIISDTMVGLVFVTVGDIVVLPASWVLYNKSVLSDCMSDGVITTGLCDCVV
jgi:hypothetical protein